MGVVQSLTEEGQNIRQLMIQLSKFSEEHRDVIDPKHQKIFI